LTEELGGLGLTDCPTLSIQQRVADLPPAPPPAFSLSLSLSLCEKFSVILFDDEVQKHDMEASTEYGMKKKNPPSGVVGSPLKNHQSYT
jgi:hypothetical protein